MEKILILLFSICFTGSAFGQGFTGRFTGNFNGVFTTLVFSQTGNTLNGEMEADGYKYTLKATASGKNAKGKLSDPQLGGVMDVDININANALTLTLLIPNPDTGEILQTPMQFQREVNGSKPATANRQDKAVQNLDPALIGIWVKNESMTSGDFTMAMQTILEFRADGTVRYGDSRVVGGGNSGSFDSGTSKDAYRGKWRAKDKIISVAAMDSNQWNDLARYYVEGGKLLTTTADGTRELWYKR